MKTLSFVISNLVTEYLATKDYYQVDHLKG